MMNAYAIISEYNPFHNGHAYQIQKTREAGATHIVAIMSGNFVQRGELALFDKHERARIAVLNGADLVIELPLPFSLGTAPDFAKAGVQIAKGLGVISGLSFGSESGDIEFLARASKEVNNISEEKLKALMSKGMSYPLAVSELVSESSREILNGANNTLALEYLKALEGTGIVPFTVKRTAEHDGNEIFKNFASASKIRNMIKNGEDTSGLISEEFSKLVPSDQKKLEQAILYKLFTMSKDDFSSVPYCDGLESRFFEASRKAGSLEALCEAIKSKNVTMARIRRAVMLAFLGITKEDMKLSPYARVLAFNEKGKEVLAQAKKKATIPISASLAELSKIGEGSNRLASLSELSSRLMHMATDVEKEYVSEFSKKFEMCK